MTAMHEATMQAIKYWLITYGTGEVKGDSYEQLLPDGLNNHIVLMGYGVLEWRIYNKGYSYRLTQKALDLIAQESQDEAD